jgi:hypothetical protein
MSLALGNMKINEKIMLTALIWPAEYQSKKL